MGGDGAVLAGMRECEIRWDTLGKNKWRCGARLTKKRKCVEMVLKLTCDSNETVFGDMVLIQVSCRLQDNGGGKLLTET